MILGTVILIQIKKKQNVFCIYIVQVKCFLYKSKQN